VSEVLKTIPVDEVPRGCRNYLVYRDCFKHLGHSTLYTFKFEYIYPEDVEITSSTGIVLSTSDTTLYTVKFEYIIPVDKVISTSSG
jgi:hypothetical protein